MVNSLVIDYKYFKLSAYVSNEVGLFNNFTLSLVLKINIISRIHMYSNVMTINKTSINYLTKRISI